jgi:hypothetical protein
VNDFRTISVLIKTAQRTFCMNTKEFCTHVTGRRVYWCFSTKILRVFLISHIRATQLVRRILTTRSERNPVLGAKALTPFWLARRSAKCLSPSPSAKWLANSGTCAKNPYSFSDKHISSAVSTVKGRIVIKIHYSSFVYVFHTILAVNSDYFLEQR